jgi:N-methylhydantoinase A
MIRVCTLAAERRRSARSGSYAIGGTEATTTDANLALGCINPNYFCGGTLIADMPAVNTALDKLAATLDVSRQEAARGIVRIANNNMVNAIKLISVNRGHDPRDFTLIAFGGGGGMHACARWRRSLGSRRSSSPICRGYSLPGACFSATCGAITCRPSAST